jgi:hypothetical protein
VHLTLLPVLMIVSLGLKLVLQFSDSFLQALIHIQKLLPVSMDVSHLYRLLLQPLKGPFVVS